jgi:anti-sigma regulatory factor (Ser/Thr protein kinase)
MAGRETPIREAMMSVGLEHATEVRVTGRQLGASRHAPAAARQFTRGFLADMGASTWCQQAGELMASELVTNALVHAKSAARLWISVADGIARIEVTDDGPGDPVLRDPGPEGGYGLRLTDMLAQSWGVIPAAGGPGKTVWFTISLSGSRQFASRLVS